MKKKLNLCIYAFCLLYGWDVTEWITQSGVIEVGLLFFFINSVLVECELEIILY